MKPIVFLDVDGVLNSFAWWDERRSLVQSASAPERDSNAWHFDPAAVARLNRLLEASGADVVVSSTWRKTRNGPDRDHVAGILAEVGVKANVIGVTPDLWGRDKEHPDRYVRGDEIQRWIDEHGFRGPFVILDDDSDMAHLLPKLIQTPIETGLGDEHVELAIAMLVGEVAA